MGCSSSREVDATAGNGPPNRLQRPPGGGTGGVAITEKRIGMGNGGENSGSGTGARQQGQGGTTNRQALPSSPTHQSSSPDDIITDTTIIPSSQDWPKSIRFAYSELEILVYKHTIANPPHGSFSCLSYISSGLQTLNQPEIIFTLQLRSHENPEELPILPVVWIEAVYEFAKGGINLEAGQLVDLEFGNQSVNLRLGQMVVSRDVKPWKDMRRFGALVHSEFAMWGVLKVPVEAIPRAAHHVIALTAEEAAVARQFGPTRVIGHVGYAVRWFPYPPMVDRDRKGDCVTMADQAGSVRSLMPVVRIYGISIVLVGGDILMTIPEGEKKREILRKYVLEKPLGAAAAFEGFMAKEADGGMLWKAGQTRATAYGRNCGPVQKMNQAFVMVGHQDSGDHYKLVEDGIGLIIRKSTWSSIREAIRHTQDITVNLQQGMRFRLEWKKTVYHNPINGQEYRADWRSYQSAPSPDQPPSTSHVKMESMVFLHEPRTDEVSGKELVTYVESVLAILEEVFPVTPIPLQGGGDTGRRVIVEIEMPKSEGWLKISAFPAPESLPLQEVLPKIAQLVQPETKVRFKFQMMIDLWGYQGPDVQFS